MARRCEASVEAVTRCARREAIGLPEGARCTCGEAVRFPDEQSEEPCVARSQEGARLSREAAARGRAPLQALGVEFKGDKENNAVKYADAPLGIGNS